MFWIVSCYNAFFWNVVGYSTKNNCLKSSSIFLFPNFGKIIPKISFYGNKILARIQFPALFVYIPICNLPHFLTTLGQSEFPGFLSFLYLSISRTFFILLCIQIYRTFWQINKRLKSVGNLNYSNFVSKYCHFLYFCAIGWLWILPKCCSSVKV